MTIPRTDPLQPQPDTSIPTRGVPLEKLEEGAIQEQIDASLPVATLAAHAITAHDSIYGLTLLGGLSVQVAGGRAHFDATVYNHLPTAFALAVSTLTYIFINGSGVVTSSTSPPGTGTIPLWQVTTDASSVTGTTDQRAVIARGGGGGGGGGGTLDTAYDFGGAGAGRTINANDNAVQIQNLEADTNPNLEIVRAAADIVTQPSVYVRADGENQPRVAIYGDKIGFGGGGILAPDVYLKRISLNEVALESSGGTVGQAIRFKDITVPATPASGNNTLIYNKLFGTNTRLFTKSGDGVELGPLGDIASEFLFQRAQVGFFSAPHTNTWNEGFYGLLGGLPTLTGAAPTMVNDANGRYINFTQTAATTGLQAGFTTINAVTRRASEARFLLKVVIPTITLCRLFIGFSNQTLATMLAADNPAGHYSGMQFSTPRADANWQYVQKDNVTQRLTASTAAMGAGAAFYVLVMCRTSLATRFDIYDSTFTLLQSSSGNFLNNMGNTTDVSFMAGIETESNALRPIQFYYANLLCQKV